jgi:uncharacterized membrane protein
MSFVKFMSSITGRALRIVVGVVMGLVGLFAVQGVWGPILAIVGLVMLLAGLLNFCLIAPIFKAPFWAKDIK